MKRVKCPDWRILERISADFYLLCCTLNSHVRYSPLYILTFPLCAPCRILDAAQFDQHRGSYEDMQNIPDKLRWLRHSRGLIQTEVAIRIGVSKHIYKSIEAGTTRQISGEMRDKLALFYGVSSEDFEDGKDKPGRSWPCEPGWDSAEVLLRRSTGSPCGAWRFGRRRRKPSASDAGSDILRRLSDQKG